MWNSPPKNSSNSPNPPFSHSPPPLPVFGRKQEKAETMPQTAPKPSPPQHRVSGRPEGCGGATPQRCTAHDVPDAVARHHEHSVGPHQCCSAVVQAIAAPVATVWSVVRRFDQPQVYKRFVKSCDVLDGDGEVGTLREVRLISGLPAVTSRERLEILDNERHVLSFRVVGGEHRLNNYRSVTTLHPAPLPPSASAAEEHTVVVESYVVDIPHGNTRDDTRVFVDTIVRLNLRSLARTAENLAKRGGAPA